MKKLLSGVLIFASIIVAALVLWTVVYNFQERLSDRQLISIAAGREVERRIGSIKYASPEDLLSRNPTCCIVLHSNHEWLQFPYQILEAGHSVVVLKYLVSSDERDNYFIAEVAVSAAGDVLDSRGIKTAIPLR